MNISSCRPVSPCYQWEDSDDECGGDRDRKSPCLKMARPCAFEDVADITAEQHSRGQSSHSSYSSSESISEPSPSCSRYRSSSLWLQRLSQSIEHLYCLWKRFCKDPFRWDILKSAFWFTLGLRLFREMCSQDDIINRNPRCIKKPPSKQTG